MTCSSASARLHKGPRPRLSPRARLARSVVCAFLLLAVFVAGTLPQGMMRVAGPEGMRLVLCTAEGMREAWVMPDGSLSDAAPTSDKRQEVSKCLAVSLSFAGVDTGAYDAPVTTEFGLVTADIARTLAPRHVMWPSARPRAPPLHS